jgi:RNA polymerase sigma-70 factor (ECF subfamily)
VGSTLADAAIDLVTAAAAAWPGVDLDELAGHVRRLLPPDLDEPYLHTLRPADLALAYACSIGDAAALAEFDRRCQPVITAALRRMNASTSSIDEVAQVVRERLLVGAAGAAPRIADYAGRGDLARWVKATAVRMYLNELRKHRREVLLGDEEVMHVAVADELDPALAYAKQLYQPVFAASFVAAMTGLESRQRTLLRYRFVDGVTVEQIAALYEVHRATAHRWLNEAREALCAAAEREVRARLTIDASEVASLRRLIISQLDVSVARLLAE